MTAQKVTSQPVSAYGHPIYTYTQQIFYQAPERTGNPGHEHLVFSKIPLAKKANGVVRGGSWSQTEFR